MLINEHNLYVDIQGPNHAPVVILLHHGLGSVRAWKYQVPALLEAGYRVVVYDRWGYGDSDARPSLSVPFFLDDRADLKALIDYLAVEQVCLVGHSDGGTIALYFAAEYPERVNSLVTIAAHIYLELPKMKIGIESIRRSFEMDIRFREALVRLHAKNGQVTFWNWYRGWMKSENLEWHMRTELGKIRCPSIVIQGLEDEHATPQHALDIAYGIPGAEIWLAPNAAHMLPQDIPELFNSKLLAFLEKNTDVQ